MPLNNPPTAQTPAPPPGKVSLINRAREHPIVATGAIGIGIMAALQVVKTFVTETAPWLVALVGPLAPTIASFAPVVVAGLLGSGVFLWLDRESQRQQRQINRFIEETRKLREDLQRKTDPGEIARQQARRERYSSRSRL